MNGPAGKVELAPPEHGQTVELVRLIVRVDVRRPLSRTKVIEAALEIEGATGEEDGRERGGKHGGEARAWTIQDVAERMGEREYRVRAAVGWLIHHGRACCVGERIRINPSGRAYGVTLYRIRNEKKPTDFVGLYAAFGLRG